MKAPVAQRLLALNREFYERFAAEYSASRRVLQPGIVRALDELAPFASLLDVGCGDARVGWWLHRQGEREPPSRYVGVDGSPALLSARRQQDDPDARFTLIEADLSRPDWTSTVSPLGAFDAAVCFAVLHHLPGEALRRRVLSDVCRLLRPGGICAVSVWRLLHLDRFRNKVQAWSRIGLSDADVDAGDLLLDWRRGGEGLRYVHEFRGDELVSLCETAGLRVLTTYHSDGATGDLGSYVVARRPHRGESS